MEGNEFLEDDVVTILETKGIHSVDELKQYRGKDSLVLQLQFLVKRRLIKLKNRIEIAQKNPVLNQTIKPDENEISEGSDRNQVDQKKRSKIKVLSRPLITETSLPGNKFRLKEQILIQIEQCCDVIMQEWSSSSPDIAATKIMNIIIPDIIKIPHDLRELDLIKLFVGAAELVGEAQTCEFLIDLQEMQTIWENDVENRRSILQNYLDQMVECLQIFVYDVLFQKLLERKISREILYRKKH